MNLMLKKMNKDQLLEYIYKLTIENDDMVKCINDQALIIKDVSDVMYTKTNVFGNLFNFIMRPFRLSNKLIKHEEYFYAYKLNSNMIKLTEDQTIKSLDYINSYEAKKFTSKSYKDMIVSITGIKICSTCGNVMNRLHNDFQRRIMNEIKSNYKYMVKDITFVSGKYSAGDFFMDTTPYLPFSAMRHLINKMKTECAQWKRRGYVEQVELLNKDIETLTNYLNDRLSSASLLDKQGNRMEVVEKVVAVSKVETKSNDVADEIKEVFKAELEKEVVAEEVKEVVEDDEINLMDAVFGADITNQGELMTNDKEELKQANKELKTPFPVKNERVKFDLDVAIKLKKAGMKYVDIAKEMGYSKSYISNKLRGK